MEKSTKRLAITHLPRVGRGMGACDDVVEVEDLALRNPDYRISGPTQRTRR